MLHMLSQQDTVISVGLGDLLKVGTLLAGMLSPGLYFLWRIQMNLARVDGSIDRVDVSIQSVKGEVAGIHTRLEKIEGVVFTVNPGLQRQG